MKKMRVEPALGAAVLILTALAATPVSAQPQTGKEAMLAAAQALYEHATADMDAGRYASACPKLEEVTRFVPEGLGAKLTLAACYEGLGRLASAWSQYAVVEVLAKRVRQAERAQRAAEKAAALRPRLATLTVRVPQVARGIAGLSIARDGIPVGEGQWGAPLPIDVGRHEVLVTAPGRTAWKAEIDVKADGEQCVIEAQVPALEPSKAPPASSGEPGLAPSVVEPVPARPWQRPLGIAVMGLGLAGIGVGATLGGLAIAKYEESNADGHCNAQHRCDAMGLDLREQAVTLGNGSTVALIVGGALAAGGTALWWTAPAGEQEQTGKRMQFTPSVGVLPGGVIVKARW